MWTATLTDNHEDFNQFIAAARFINGSPESCSADRLDFDRGRKESGFQARSVVGGVYIPLLANPVVEEVSSKARSAAAR